MILRRFTKHVTDQNWFAVGLDVIVVIVGIFLGFQVQGWNQERQIRAEESDYLSRLHRDFSKSISDNERNIIALSNQNSLSEFAIKTLLSCQLEDEDKDRFATSMFNIGKYRPPFLVNGVIDELRTTGKFLIIKNVDLRMAISEHVDLINSYDETDSKVSDRIHPHVVYVEKFLFYNIDNNSSGYEEITWAELPIEIDQLCKIEGVAKAISLIKSYLIGNLNRSKGVVVQQRAILKRIEAEMKKTK